MEKTIEPHKSSTYIPGRGSLADLPWWALILILAGLLIIYLILGNSNYRETFLFLKDGVRVTLEITITAFPIATIIGLFLGLARLSKNPVLQTVSTLYIEVVRGIPLVVLILLVAFGLVPLSVDLVNNLGKAGLTMAPAGFLGNIFNSFANFNIRSIPLVWRAIIALAIGY